MIKIAVIGAGLSGLTAARRFQQAGHEVVVLEANAHAGGRCKVLKRDGFIIDTGPELAATSYRRWLNMIHEVDMGDSVHQCSTVVSMLQKGKLIDIDMGNLLSSAFTPALSWGAKWRFLCGVFGMRKEIKSVPHYFMDDISLDDPNSNAESKSLEAFGQEVTDNLIEPLLRPICGVTLDLSSSLLLPYTLADWTQMVTIKGGLQQLPIKMASELDVRFQTTVKQVHSNSDNVTINYTDSDGNDSTLTVDKCLITIPYDLAEDIYPRFAEISNNYRNTTDYMRIIDVKLAYSKAPASKASMVMLSVKEAPQINVISLSHHKSPDRAPAGHGLFSIFTEHKEFDTVAAMSDEEIERLIRTEIERLYPEVKGHFLFSHIARQRRVSYVPNAGFFHRTKALWDAVGTEPRVQLGGDVFMFGGMEAAVASGERAAERLMSV